MLEGSVCRKSKGEATAARGDRFHRKPPVMGFHDFLGDITAESQTVLVIHTKLGKTFKNELSHFHGYTRTIVADRNFDVARVIPSGFDRDRSVLGREFHRIADEVGQNLQDSFPITVYAQGKVPKVDLKIDEADTGFVIKILDQMLNQLTDVHIALREDEFSIRKAFHIQKISDQTQGGFCIALDDAYPAFGVGTELESRLLVQQQG